LAEIFILAYAYTMLAANAGSEEANDEASRLPDTAKISE
jgi:hypothetical protein